VVYPSSALDEVEGVLLASPGFDPDLVGGDQANGEGAGEIESFASPLARSGRRVVDALGDCFESPLGWEPFESWTR
jgi:hypothetical protein